MKMFWVLSALFISFASAPSAQANSCSCRGATYSEGDFAIERNWLDSVMRQKHGYNPHGDSNRQRGVAVVEFLCGKPGQPACAPNACGAKVRPFERKIGMNGPEKVKFGAETQIDGEKLCEDYEQDTLRQTIATANRKPVKNPITGSLAQDYTWDNANGKQAAAEVLREHYSQIFPASHPATMLVRRQLSRIAEKSGAPDELIPLAYVINDPELNAFALPGGYVFVHAGLIAASPSESALAGALAHEWAHAVGRHGAQGMHQATKVIKRAKWFSTITSYAMLGVSLWAGFGGSWKLDLFEKVVTHFALPYGVTAVTASLITGKSRSLEDKADDLGFQYLVEAGYDPRGMGEMFSTIKQVQDSPGFNPFGFLFRTHPDAGTRAEKANARAKAAIAKDPTLAEPLDPSPEYLAVKAALPPSDRVLKRLQQIPGKLALSVEGTLEMASTHQLSAILEPNRIQTGPRALTSVVDMFETDVQGKYFGRSIREGQFDGAMMSGTPISITCDSSGGCVNNR